MISIDASKFFAWAETVQRVIREAGMLKQAAQTLKGVSLALEGRVKDEMPVDTGRARASWGHGGEGIWLEAPLEITQGSNVVYIPFLNAGHSQQAPAGFIDRAELQAQLELETTLGFIDPLSTEYNTRRAESVLVRAMF